MYKPSLTEIKDNIAYARKQVGLTQEDMAKTLNISQPAYSYYEKGDKPIPLEKIKSISEILSIPLTKLIGDIANDNEDNDILIKIASSLDRIANVLEKMYIKM